jgi:basic membrane protein A
MKVKYLLILLLIAGLLVACGGDETEEPAAEEPAAEVEAPAEEAEEPAEEVAEEVSADADTEGIEAIRIAIVMPSTITDLAWSQAIYDALLSIQDEAGGADVVELAYSEGMFNV